MYLLASNFLLDGLVVSEFVSKGLVVSVCVCTHWSLRPVSVRLAVCPFVLCTSLSVARLPVCLFVRLSVYLFVCLFMSMCSCRELCFL